MSTASPFVFTCTQHGWYADQITTPDLAGCDSGIGAHGATAVTAIGKFFVEDFIRCCCVNAGNYLSGSDCRCLALGACDLAMVARLARAFEARSTSAELRETLENSRGSTDKLRSPIDCVPSKCPTIREYPHLARADPEAKKCSDLHHQLRQSPA
jgi:hypothetical protein